MSVARLAMLFVAPGEQRRGVGRALWRAVLAATTARVITVNSSPNSTGVYVKLGFTPTAEERTEKGIRFVAMRYERPG